MAALRARFILSAAPPEPIWCFPLSPTTLSLQGMRARCKTPPKACSANLSFEAKLYQSCTLATLRATLLPKLLIGELAPTP